MRAKYMRDQIELSISGADGLANNIPQASVKSYQLILPSVSEQKAIVKMLRGRTEQMVAQEALVSAAINTLREYRSALITNAVTGKIDVRHFEIPQPAKEITHD
jgi:type I restriction enzyme S subunit